MTFLNLWQRVFAPRLCAPTPTFTRPLLQRNVHLTLRELPERPIAPKREPTKLQSGIARPIENIQTAEDFLKAIGRESEKKLKVEWDEMWKMDGRAMREAGVGTRDRRYILWCMQKYRLGFPIREFAHEPPPKKTIRGWGPKVQNGKRIRSRRIKDKTLNKK